MVFNSYTFIALFAVVMLVMRMRLSWRSKKGILLVSSYLFYAAWNPPFVILLWFSTVVDWFVCKGLAATDNKTRKKALVVVSLSTNLGLLGYFKYGGFVLENFVGILGQFGFQYQPLALDIILPIGISFYTFQTLSYTLDVYRGDLKPWPSFLDFALFVTFFPQLVAGPIVRARDFLPQTTVEPSPTPAHVGWGLSLITLGLFQKVALADGLLASIAETVFDSPLSPSPLTAGVGILAFTGQIFCDFAGYSTIAIGAAMVLGFSLPDNFRFPYAAIGFSDFWQRWHVSLSTWLRDYLYISLGGNRGGASKTYRNLIITMLLGGLWHGASWNFVIWGGLHAGFLVGERLLHGFVGTWRVWTTGLGKLALGGLTFGLVSLSWVFFRAPTLERSLEILKGLFLVGPRELYVSNTDLIITVTVVGFLLAAHAALRNTTIEQVAGKCPRGARMLIIGLMLLAIFLSPGEDRAFIYFQF